MSTGKDQSLFAPARYVDKLEDCFFYHAMDLPGLGLVRAHWDLRESFDNYIGGVQLEGKSVLDIGTASGFLSFEAEKRGASRVVSFDMKDASQQNFLPFKNKLHYQDPKAWAKHHSVEVEQWKNAYWLCHRLLGSEAQVYYGDINNLPNELGQFDVAIIGSVLEHLNDQVGALASISRLTKETMVIVTPVLETEEPIARFEPKATNPDSDFTWWTYSIGVYREVFAMLGFTIAKVSQNDHYYMYGDRYEPRTTIVAERDH